MRDIVGHDRQPAAYLVYQFLRLDRVCALGTVPCRLRMVMDVTGPSKSAVQTALEFLRRCEFND